MHLRNVFAGGELEPKATTKEFLAVRTEGRRRVRRRLKYYNLDAIVSVDYPVAETRCVGCEPRAGGRPDRASWPLDHRAMKAVVQPGFSPSGA